MNESLPRRNKIVTPRDYRKIQNNSKKKHSKYFTLFISEGRTRIGITISNKVGNSPERHYLKRCIKEVFRKNKNLFNKQDVVLIAKPEMNGLDYHQIYKEIIRILGK